MVLGQTIDPSGQPHALVLHAAGIREATQHSQCFVVLSASTTFSITGEAVADGWQFVVGSHATGPAAPLVVLKYATRSLTDLADDPATWTDAVRFNDDVGAAAARLSAVTATVIARAKQPGPAASTYSYLADTVLQDPTWTGALIFNASVPAVPDTATPNMPVISTGPLAGVPVAAFALGFTSPSHDPGSSAPPESALFAVIDRTWDAGDAPAPDAQHLRVQFENTAMTAFSMD